MLLSVRMMMKWFWMPMIFSCFTPQCFKTGSGSGKHLRDFDLFLTITLIISQSFMLMFAFNFFPQRLGSGKSALPPASEMAEDDLAEYEVSTEEFKFVERILPPKTVPSLPQHDSYPTPSGWYPPKGRSRFLEISLHSSTVSNPVLYMWFCSE